MTRLADAIVAEMKTVRVGPPMDPASEMGPIAMKRQLERIEGYIEKGKEEGATLVAGGAARRTSTAAIISSRRSSPTSATT